LSTSALTKLEQGVTTPGWETLLKLAEALGVSLDAFKDIDAPPADAPAPKRARRKGN